MKTDRILYTIIAAALLAVSGHVTAAHQLLDFVLP